MAEAVKKPNANEIYQGLTGTQKCAILMMLIGEDEAAEIMGNLSPKRSTSPWISNVLCTRFRARHS